MKGILSILVVVILISCNTTSKEPAFQRWNGADTLKIFMDSATDPTPIIHQYNKVEFIHTESKKEKVKHPKFTSPKIEKYVLKYYKTAQQEDSLFNIPASITLAQGILESGCGLSTLAKKDNAHFGIKPGPWTGEKKLYPTKEWDSKKKKFVTVMAYFRTYSSPWWSYRNRSHFLTKTERYKPCFDCGSDYKCWAVQLKKCGYATDPNYTKSLINLIKTNKLYEYDRGNKKRT